MKKVLSLLMSFVMLISITAGLELTVNANTSGDFEYKVLDNGTAEITRYTGSSDDLKIPSDLDGNTVSSIGNYAFSYCLKAVEIEIADSNEKIGVSAFYNCPNLKKITISNSVTKIGSCAFWGCSSLAEIEIPVGVTSIGHDAFYDCIKLASISVDANNQNYSSSNGVLFDKNQTVLIQYPIGNTDTSYTIPDGVTIINDKAFKNCSALTSVRISEGVTDIGISAFNNCIGLTNAEIADSVTDIHSKAFQNCTALSGLTIPDGVKNIGSYAFGDCTNLTNIKIGSNVTNIGIGAFENCIGLKSVTIPEGVTDIFDNTFKDCTSLTNIEIGSKVKNIGKNVFENCTALTSITIPANVTSIESGAFKNCTNLRKTNYAGSIIQWCGINFSAADSNPISCSGNLYIKDVLLENITIKNCNINNYALYGCKSLKSIEILNREAKPDEKEEDAKKDVKQIGTGAFENCTNLVNAVIPGNVTSIGNKAFYHCGKLMNITVDSENEYYSSPNGVLFNKKETILIQYPIGITESSYAVPNSVQRINNNAFSGCNNLTNITIPNSVTVIGNNAFESCGNLTSMTIPDSVTDVDDSAFIDCSSLADVTIGNSVVNIGSSAFKKCSSLTNVTIPGSVTSIGNSAFSECVSLTNIIVDSDNKSYSSLNGVLFNKDNTELIQYPIGNAGTTYIVPNGVKNIDGGAFDGCASLTSITVPNSVKNIGDGAFNGCKKLSDVNYSGTKKQWKKIKINANNKYLEDALIHCNDGTINEKETTKTPTTKPTTKPTKPTIQPTAPTAPAQATTKVSISATSPAVIPQQQTTDAEKAGITTRPASIKVGGTVYKLDKNGDYVSLKAKKPSISKTTKAKKSLKVTWKKISAVSGYQVQYSTSKKFAKKTVKTKTVKGNKSKKPSVKIKNLKSKKAYYIRLRTYKTVKVNGKTTKVYSSWSKVKTATTK